MSCTPEEWIAHVHEEETRKLNKRLSILKNQLDEMKEQMLTNPCGNHNGEPLWPKGRQVVIERISIILRATSQYIYYYYNERCFRYRLVDGTRERLVFDIDSDHVVDEVTMTTIYCRGNFRRNRDGQSTLLRNGEEVLFDGVILPDHDWFSSIKFGTLESRADYFYYKGKQYFLYDYYRHGYIFLSRGVPFHFNDTTCEITELPTGKVVHKTTNSKKPMACDDYLVVMGEERTATIIYY